MSRRLPSLSRWRRLLAQLPTPLPFPALITQPNAWTQRWRPGASGCSVILIFLLASSLSNHSDAHSLDLATNTHALNGADAMRFGSQALQALPSQQPGTEADSNAINNPGNIDNMGNSPDNADTTAAMQIALGAALFSDTRLSDQGVFSCTSCHQPEKAYSDGRDFSLDNQGQPLALNTPDISYSTLNFYISWSGKFANLSRHLDGLIANPRIMSTNWADIVARLSSDAAYLQLFYQAGYPSINAASITDAIIAFERSLNRPSAFDYYLRGEGELSAQALRGFQKFSEYGCVSCHQGKNIGGNMRQRFGLMADYFDQSQPGLTEKPIKQRDLGYFNHSQDPQDRFFFRVPSLRNVALTAPYFHDASAKTLEQAIRVMFKHQLGISANDQDIDDIKAFLQTLTSEQYTQAAANE